MKEVKSSNSKDIEGLKRISRGLLKFGNNLILKDEAIKLAKLENDKRFIKYVNDIYGKSNKISYKDFVKKAIPKPGSKWSLDPYEKEYQTTQRLMPDDRRNKTLTIKISPDIDKLVKELYIVNYNLYDKLARLLNKGHFKDTTSFIRYTKINDNWIHIDAIQTDLFNGIKRIASKNKPKGKSKKLISSLLAMELDSYKAGVSAVKKINKDAKIWTMNTPEMAVKAEHIQSGNKISTIYNTLPPKLGFKKIPIEQLVKIISTRKNKKKDNRYPINRKKIGIKHDFLEQLNNSTSQNVFKNIMNVFKEKENKVKKLIEDHADRLKSSWNVSRSSFQRELQMILKIIYINRTQQEDTALLDIAHMVSTKIQNNLFNRKFILDKELYKIIIKSIENLDLIKEKNKETKKTDIWWANRGMINEEKISILNVLMENL